MTIHPDRSIQRNRLHEWVRILLLGTISLFIVGCELTVPNTVNDATNRTDELDVAAGSSSSEIWFAMARATKAKTITTTTRLAQYVVVLARNQELTEHDIVAFEVMFPKIATGERDLTQNDIENLLELGRKAP